QSDGAVAMDAMAREGQTEMVRQVLIAAPELATESRALLAADHPETEALIRGVARGEVVLKPSGVGGPKGMIDPAATPGAKPKRVTLKRVSPSPDGPAFKGAARYHFPHRPGHIAASDIPEWARPHIADSDTTFTGPAQSLLTFDASGQPHRVDSTGR